MLCLYGAKDRRLKEGSGREGSGAGGKNCANLLSFLGIGFYECFSRAETAEIKLLSYQSGGDVTETLKVCDLIFPCRTSHGEKA